MWSWCWHTGSGSGRPGRTTARPPRLGLAVLTLYAGLLVLSVLGGAALIPRSVYDCNVGHAPALADYLKLGWLAATIATLAGALGSLIESDESVREAAYRHHADARTEENEDER